MKIFDEMLEGYTLPYQLRFSRRDTSYHHILQQSSPPAQQTVNSHSAIGCLNLMVKSIGDTSSTTRNFWVKNRRKNFWERGKI